ncbi:RmlC-like cupin [Trichodelitschia bisporula]|uniref:RmlC-like cupin n=1 Tax=Trichodelitschia bisporula TaxID=703511 RepID=A0A6G1HIQ2_9PEZI|nr:RmlC-like cupin [Trichodelitschia bisporula]
MSFFKTVVLALAATAVAVPASNPTWTTSWTSSSTGVSRAGTPAPAGSIRPVIAPAAADQKTLAEKLATKITAVDQAKELFLVNGKLKTGDDLRGQTVFDFNTAAPAKNDAGVVIELGGRKAAAAPANFPFLTNKGLSTTVAFLEPCGMNTPHVHPRGNEWLTVVDGSLEFGMILENGFAGEITGSLDKFQGTVFPQGAVHYQFNPSCDPATFVATLNNGDAGTNSIAQAFFGLNGEVISATTGFQFPQSGQNIDAFRGKIPVSLAKGVETCLAKCKIPKL